MLIFFLEVSTELAFSSLCRLWWELGRNPPTELSAWFGSIFILFSSTIPSATHILHTLCYILPVRIFSRCYSYSLWSTDSGRSVLIFIFYFRISWVDNLQWPLDKWFLYLGCRSYPFICYHPCFYDVQLLKLHADVWFIPLCLLLPYIPGYLEQYSKMRKKHNHAVLERAKPQHLVLQSINKQKPNNSKYAFFTK